MNLRLFAQIVLRKSDKESQISKQKCYYYYYIKLFLAIIIFFAIKQISKNNR